MPKPSIGAVLALAGRNIQDSITAHVQVSVLKWLDDNKSELLSALAQADHERGYKFLEMFCKRFPLAAGAVTMAMNGTVDDAIAAIAVFDRSLAVEAGRFRQNFIELQEYWRVQNGAA